MPDGAGLRLTTARYYTPSGRSIQATGIVPDVEVPLLPYVKEKEEERVLPDFLREADLKNHILNRQNPAADKKKKSETTPTPKNDRDDKQAIARKLKEDNQLRTALNILKSLNLYTEYKTAAEPEAKTSQH